MIVESQDTLQFSDMRVFALTLLGEARGLHTPVGMQEVACVVRNRVQAHKWWGDTERTVCLYPWQFSCWNENDPNRAKLLTWAEDAADYLQALDIATQAMMDVPEDLTGGATHYFNHLTIPQAKWPKWYVGQPTCHEDGAIWFFDLSAGG